MLLESFRTYVLTAFRWQRGRQDTGYDKMLLLAMSWPLPLDSYLIHYPEGSEIPPHRDPVKSGRHYRLNIILKSCGAGGEFICETSMFTTKRIKLFRPDLHEHSVTKVIDGSRYVLSIGWILD